MAKRSIIYIVITLALLVLITAPVYAGFSDWFRGITGRASTTQGTNLSITVTGTNSVNVSIDNTTLEGTVTDPTEGTINTITFNVTVEDVDGVNDIDDTSVNATFVLAGQGTRVDTSCTLIEDFSANEANFTCSIEMWYFDAEGIWTIYATARDLGNLSNITDTSSFQFNQLKAIVVGPSSISFLAVAPGDENVTSNNDPTEVNNTGNYNSTNVTFTTVHLHGETVGTEFISVENFSISTTNGGSPAVECDDVTPVNGSATQIIGGTNGLSNATLGPGNNSIDAGDGSSGQEEFYYCIIKVPTSISSQTYSTTAAGAWVITIV